MRKEEFVVLEPRVKGYKEKQENLKQLQEVKDGLSIFSGLNDPGGIFGTKQRNGHNKIRLHHLLGGYQKEINAFVLGLVNREIEKITKEMEAL